MTMLDKIIAEEEKGRKNNILFIIIAIVIISLSAFIPTAYHNVRLIAGLEQTVDVGNNIKVQVNARWVDYGLQSDVRVLNQWVDATGLYMLFNLPVVDVDYMDSNKNIIMSVTYRYSDFDDWHRGRKIIPTTLSECRKIRYVVVRTHGI